MIEVMKPKFFDISYLVYLTEKYFSYYNDYKCFPSLSLLISVIKDDLNEGENDILVEQIIDFLHRIKHNPNMGDLKYVKKRVLINFNFIL